MMLWLAIVACTQEAGPTSSSPALPIPELVTTPTVAEWSADEAVRALVGALAGDFPSPFRIRESLNGWFSHGDPGCPGEGTYMAGPSFEGCTAQSGWFYLGVGGYSESLSEDDVGPYVELNMMGDLTIVDPEGASIDIGGHWIAVLREGPSWRGVLNGSWVEPNNPADWLATGMSGWLEYAGTVNPDGHLVSLDGALALRGQAVQFTTVNLGVEGCGETPTGAIGIRDPSGGAWTFDFGIDCRPCGAVAFEGQPVETDACLALDGLADRVIRASGPPQ